MFTTKERNIFMTKVWDSLKNKAQQILLQQENKELKEDQHKGKEIDYHRYWKDQYEKEHKLRQEAEGELSIMKGIETNRVKEAQARCDHLQNELDRVKKENNDLFNRIADSLEVNESHQKMNGKLQERLTELEEENKKLHEHFDKKIDSARKAGL